MIALRQAAFEPVVACMGTALTEAQLKELGRLTKRLWLAFDGDAAGAAATLRGMEIADRQGFDVKVVALPPGVDPADDPAGFQGRLAAALPYEVHRVQVEARSTDDREAARRAVTAFLDARPDSLNRRAAWNWANDHFGMPIQIRGGGTWVAKEAPSPRIVAAADKIERGALAGVIVHRELLPLLAAIPPDGSSAASRTASCARTSSTVRPHHRRHSRSSPSSTTGRRRKGSTSRLPRSTCGG